MNSQFNISSLKKTMTTKVRSEKYNEGKGLSVSFYDKGKLIGHASTVVYKGKANNFLHNVEVKKEYRNQGYGNIIVSYMIKRYGVQYLYVKKDNEIAIKIYKKFGFKEIDKFENYLVMFRQ